MNKIKTGNIDTNTRLDVYLSQELDYTRSFFKKLISDKKVKVNNKFVKPSFLLKKDDIIEYEPVILSEQKIKPEPLPIEIIYETDNFIIVNKPQGMITHPAGSIVSGTLVNAILNHTSTLSDLHEDVTRPGIVHRLDKDTSGLIIISKNNKTHAYLSDQFKHRKIKKNYLAVLKGKINKKLGYINLPVGRNKRNRKLMCVTPNGRVSETYFRVITSNEHFSFVQVAPITGRTHQIRVHFKHLGHPVVGDQIYAKKQKSYQNLLLHSFKITFNPDENSDSECYTVDLPDYYLYFLKNKFKIDNAFIQKLKFFDTKRLMAVTTL